MKKVNLDERQLWLRGEVFKHSLFLMGSLLLLKAFLADINIQLVDSEWAEIFIVSITAAFGNIKMALRGAFDFDEKRMSVFAIIMGVCGSIILFLNIFHIFNGESLILEGGLSRTGAFLIMSLAFLAIPAAYFVKRSQYRKRQLMETEE